MSLPSVASRVLGFSFLPLLLSTGAAVAQTATRPQAGVVVDVSGGSADTLSAAALSEWLAQYGFVRTPPETLAPALQAPGAQAGGRVTSDPVQLELLRRRAGETLVVRAFVVQGATGQSETHLMIVDAAGRREAMIPTPPPDRMLGRLVELMDATYRLRPTPIAGAPPPAAPPVVAPAAPAAPAPASPSVPPVDRVFLADGTVVEGTILEQVPGAFVTLRHADGAVETLAWGSVQRVVLAPRSGAAPVTETRTNVNANGSGLTYAQAEGCQPGEPVEKCNERLRVQAGPNGAQLQRDVNCAPGSTEERCHEHLAAGVGSGGAGLSYSQQSVTRVHGPKSAAFNLLLNAGGIYGTSLKSSNFNLVGGTLALGFTLIAGSQFPGEEGGSFNGVFLEPSGSLQVMGLAGGGGGGSATIGGVQGGGALGWQYIHFGKLDPESLKQSGFGFRLGGFVGVEYLSITQKTDMPVFDGASGFTTVPNTTTTHSTEAAYGPTIGFSSTSYNPGTASFHAFDVNLFVLPTGDFLFASIAIGVRI